MIKNCEIGMVMHKIMSEVYERLSCVYITVSEDTRCIILLF